MLRGHVRQGAADAARLAGRFRVFGQVEVEEHRLPLVGQQHVGRLEVAVQHAALVGVGQPLGQPRPIHRAAST